MELGGLLGFDVDVVKVIISIGSKVCWDKECKNVGRLRCDWGLQRDTGGRVTFGQCLLEPLGFKVVK